MSTEKNIVTHILRTVKDRLNRKEDEIYWTSRGFFTIEAEMEATILEDAREYFRKGGTNPIEFAKKEAANMAGDEGVKARAFLSACRIAGALHYENMAETLLMERQTAPTSKYNTVKGSRTLTRNARAWRNNGRTDYRTGIKID